MSTSAKSLVWSYCLLLGCLCHSLLWCPVYTCKMTSPFNAFSPKFPLYLAYWGTSVACSVLLLGEPTLSSSHAPGAHSLSAKAASFQSPSWAAGPWFLYSWIPKGGVQSSPPSSCLDLWLLSGESNSLRFPLASLGYLYVHPHKGEEESGRRTGTNSVWSQGILNIFLCPLTF